MFWNRKPPPTKFTRVTDYMLNGVTREEAIKRIKQIY